ncbi:MAG: hypothetical protein ACT4P6_00980 [Gemmatimonadaceae bacterium]
MAARGIRSEVAVVQQIGVGDTLVSGARGGMVGGACMALFAMGTSIMGGSDILSPFRLTGATFVGAGALEGGIGVIVYGLLLYIAASVAWGVLFAAILPREATAGLALIAGLIYGLIVMLVTLQFVLPVANPVMREAVNGTTSFTLAHLIYGGSLAIVPLLRRRFAVTRS